MGTSRYIPPNIPRGNGRQRPKRRPSIRSFNEQGKSGLRRWGDQVDDEGHKALRGDKALHVYDEMQRNDATVGAVLFAIKQMVRQVDWRVETDGESPEDERAKELIETSLDDMSYSFADTLTEILSMLPFGFSFHEIVYKRRTGQTTGPGTGSKYDDGLIGWRKWAPRAQLTRTGWEFDDDGGIRGMWQQAAPEFDQVFLPIERALLFRTELHKNNPEGRSILRNAYVSWYFLKGIQPLEAIAIEREGAGIPVARIPSFLLDENEPTGKGAGWKTMARQLKMNEHSGLVLPSDRDENGNYIYDLELLKNESRRAIDTNTVIARLQRDIAGVVLADFLKFGGENTGSQSLGKDRRTMFETAIDSYVTQIETVINRHAIPRLLHLNGIVLETMPELRHGEVGTPDMAAVAETVSKLAGAGMPIFPDEQIENSLRRSMYWDELTEEDFEEREGQAAEDKRAEQEAAAGELDRLRADAERMRGGAQAQPQPEQGAEE